MSPNVTSGILGIGFVVVFQMMIIATAQAFPILAPQAAFSIGFKPEYIGYFSTVVFFSAMLSSNGTAGLLRRFGSIRSTAITLVISGIGALILAGADSIAGLMLGALVLGVAYGPVNPAASILLMRFSQGYRPGLIFSIKQTSIPIGGAAAGALLPLVAALFGWRGGMLTVAYIAFGVAFLAWVLSLRLGDDADPSASLRFQGPIRPARILLSDTSLGALSISVFCFSTAQFGLMSIYVTFLWSYAGLSPGQSAAMLSVALAVSIVGRLIWGWLADSGRPIRILAGLAGAGSLAMLAMLMLTRESPIYASIIISAALGLGPLSWSGVFLAKVANEGVARGGEQALVSITAGMMVFGYLGAMLGPSCLSLSAALFNSYAPGTLAIASMLAFTTVILIRHDGLLETYAGGPPA